MRTCERHVRIDDVEPCGKPAAWVRMVNITEWKDGKPGKELGSRPEYLCEEHGRWHQKMGHSIKKLHVLAVG